jgi:hypothetical protein
MTTITTTSKSRENRLRRQAERLGYMLVKSRKRDYAGLYVLVGDSRGNRIGQRGGQAAISAFYKDEGQDLDGIEQELQVLDR